MEIDFILTYVPEIDFLTYKQALELAHERDLQAAQNLLWSIQDD